MINTYFDLGKPVEIPGSDKIVFGLVPSENGFRVMNYDVPGLTEGGIAGGGATLREMGTTVTEQAVFVSISAPTVGELQAHRGALAVDATVVEPLAAFGVECGVRGAGGSVRGGEEYQHRCRMTGARASRRDARGQSRTASTRGTRTRRGYPQPNQAWGCRARPAIGRFDHRAAQRSALAYPSL